MTTKNAPTFIVVPTVDDLMRTQGYVDRAVAETVYSAIKAMPDGDERLRQMSGPTLTEQMIRLADELGPDMYKAAADEGLPFSMWLDKQAPASPYSGGDTFEHLLAHVGIRTRHNVAAGIRANTVTELRSAGKSMGEFNQGAVLLPELMSRAHRQGQLWGPTWLQLTMDEAYTVQRLYASTSTISPHLQPEMLKTAMLTTPLRQPTLINRLVATTEVLVGAKTWSQFYVDTSDVENYSYRRILEGGTIPTIEIMTGTEHTGRVHGYGRRLLFTYEVEQLSLPMLQLWISLFAVQASKDEESQIISVLINGDGNPATAATETDISSLNLVVAGSITEIPGEGILEYLNTVLEEGSHYANYDLALAKGYSKTLVQLATVGTSDQLLFSAPSPVRPSEATNPQTMVFPEMWAHPDVPTYKIVFVDTSQAIVRYAASGTPVVESDKIIRRRMNEVTFYTEYGHQSLMPGVVEILDYQN